MNRPRLTNELPVSSAQYLAAVVIVAAPLVRVGVRIVVVRTAVVSTVSRVRIPAVGIASVIAVIPAVPIGIVGIVVLVLTSAPVNGISGSGTDSGAIVCSLPSGDLVSDVRACRRRS